MSLIWYIMNVSIMNVNTMLVLCRINLINHSNKFEMEGCASV